jgi:hypothetical protein
VSHKSAATSKPNWEENYGDDKTHRAQDGTHCPQDGTQGGTHCPQDGTQGGTYCPQDGTQGGTHCPQDDASQSDANCLADQAKNSGLPCRGFLLPAETELAFAATKAAIGDYRKRYGHDGRLAVTGIMAGMARHCSPTALTLAAADGSIATL